VVKPSSLLTHTVQVDSIAIEGLEITVEQNGMRNNLNDLLATVQGQTAATGNAANTPPGKELKMRA